MCLTLISAIHVHIIKQKIYKQKKRATSCSLDQTNNINKRLSESVRNAPGVPPLLCTSFSPLFLRALVELGRCYVVLNHLLLLGCILHHDHPSSASSIWHFLPNLRSLLWVVSVSVSVSVGGVSECEWEWAWACVSFWMQHGRSGIQQERSGNQKQPFSARCWQLPMPRLPPSEHYTHTHTHTHTQRKRRERQNGIRQKPFSFSHPAPSPLRSHPNLLLSTLPPLPHALVTKAKHEQLRDKATKPKQHKTALSGESVWCDVKTSGRWWRRTCARVVVHARCEICAGVV